MRKRRRRIRKKEKKKKEEEEGGGEEKEEVTNCRNEEVTVSSFTLYSNEQHPLQNTMQGGIIHCDKG